MRDDRNQSGRRQSPSLEPAREPFPRLDRSHLWIAVLIASCGRFGYEPLRLDPDGGASGGSAGMANGGASSSGAGGGGTTGGGGSGVTDGGGGSSAGAGGLETGGAGGAMSVDAGGPPDDSGASGAAGAEPNPVDDAGSEFDAGTLPTCFDDLQNQDEVGVDCGGASCTPCPCSFGAPQGLGNPNAGGSDLWSPTLSGDGLTMYFSLTQFGGERVAIATRSDRGDSFGFGSALPAPVNSSTAGTPELSADGRSLYFFSQRFGGTGDRDLYVATRSSTADQFNTVTELTALNSTQREDRPFVSPDELTVYFVSHRASLTDDLWRASRNARSDAFGTPVPVTELNSSGNDSGLFVTPDGKVAYFASDRSGGLGVDIYRAVRANTSSAFSTPERLSVLNSSADDFDPQLTADGQELFFATTRSGSYQIWRSLVTCP
jgi:hypothetical protein